MAQPRKSPPSTSPNVTMALSAISCALVRRERTTSSGPGKMKRGICQMLTTACHNPSTANADRNPSAMRFLRERETTLVTLLLAPYSRNSLQACWRLQKSGRALASADCSRNRCQCDLWRPDQKACRPYGTCPDSQPRHRCRSTPDKVCQPLP